MGRQIARPPGRSIGLLSLGKIETGHRKIPWSKPMEAPMVWWVKTHHGTFRWRVARRRPPGPTACTSWSWHAWRFQMVPLRRVDSTGPSTSSVGLLFGRVFLLAGGEWLHLVAINLAFSHEYWVSIIIPIDGLIFFRGVGIQPPTRECFFFVLTSPFIDADLPMEHSYVKTLRGEMCCLEPFPRMNLLNKMDWFRMVPLQWY